jgi:hypothetical protein
MEHHFPAWLVVISWIWIGVGAACFFIIFFDETKRPQHMWIMNLVWPITALYSGVIGLYAYYKVGLLSTHHSHMTAQKQHTEPPDKKKPFWQTAAVGTTHCGSGCTLGDLCAEWFTFFVPFDVGMRIFGSWIVDYILAFLFGIVFQYFTIKPMRGLSVGKGIKEALKADALSLTAWQVGMYGWMAIATFAIFGFELPKTSPVFWFMMQIGMYMGFISSYPVNWWLIKAKIKETM